MLLASSLTSAQDVLMSQFLDHITLVANTEYGTVSTRTSVLTTNGLLVNNRR